MNDFGSLVFFLALMAVMSLMDAFTRAARRRKMEEMEREEAEEATPGARQPRAQLPREARIPTETKEELSGEYPAGDGWVSEEQGIEEWVTEEVIIEPPVTEAPVAGDAVAEESAPPPLVAAAEALRAARRRALTELPTGPAGTAPERRPPSAARPPSIRLTAGRADRLRIAFRGDPEALRLAVLYREILGGPLGSRPEPGGWVDPTRP